MSTLFARPLWLPDDFDVPAPQRLAALREQLASRDHMRALMREGKTVYWQWRGWAQQEVTRLSLECGEPAPDTTSTTPPLEPPALKFASDLDALARAFDLLHTLNTEDCLEEEEQQLVHDIRSYLKWRSEPA